mmetsp:Transcript_8950/g.12505  ORF Transcript_8950/g.12505 Transcript_8950/m.12505 type:complete len:137 (-) Transcript_8950:151-561(-)
MARVGDHYAGLPWLLFLCLALLPSVVALQPKSHHEGIEYGKIVAPANLTKMPDKEVNFFFGGVHASEILDVPNENPLSPFSLTQSLTRALWAAVVVIISVIVISLVSFKAYNSKPLKPSDFENDKAAPGPLANEAW